jgi:xanthine/uracil/vitamin C permease (AzgA family)
MRFYAWWMGMPRQGRTGWTLVTVATIYILYFLKARLFETGPAITTREWLAVIAMFVLIMLGTINIRMAEMRQRRQGTLPLIDPNVRTRK